MDSLHGLWFGFSLAVSWGNLLACFLGVFVGTIVGVLPGLGPVGAMALLLPSTFALHPTTALIMLAGIYYGTMYGGSTTSILLNVPGEATSVITCLDGYQMSRKGRAGAALAVAAAGSFVAGTLGVIGLSFLAPLLANWAVKFGSPEFFAFMLVGLILVSQIGEESMVRALVMVGLGLVLGTVGMDTVTGVTRFTFGHTSLGQGVDLVPVAMGLYGISEMLVIAEQITARSEPTHVKLRDLLPTRKEWQRATPPILRGSVLGFFVGLIPGPATILSTFYSYTLEKRISRHPEEFGQGAIEGVAGPESANNSASIGVLVPLLSLGLPFGAAAAMLLGGLMIHGVTPGPLLVTQHPEIFWGVVASMYIGNLMLLVLNLPLVGLFVNILRIPQHALVALILLICVIGAFSVNNSLLDVWILFGMGIIGYFLRKFGFNLAPLILGLVLGPLMERRLSESLIMTRGNVWDIISRPLTASIFLIGFAILILPPLMRLMKGRKRRTA